MDEKPAVTVEAPTEWWKILETMGLPQPVLPREVEPWRESFVANLTKQTPRQAVYRAPPLPPTREIPTEYADDEDGEWVPIEWRRLSDEEWAAALEAHAKDCAGYRATNGLLGFVKAGREVYELELSYKSGRTKIVVDFVFSETAEPEKRVWYYRGLLFEVGDRS